MEQIGHKTHVEATTFKTKEFYNTHLERALSGIDPELAELVLLAKRKRMKIGVDGNPEMQMMYEKHEQESHETALSKSDSLKAFWVDYLAGDYTADFNLNIQLRDCCWTGTGRPCDGCEKKFELGLVSQTI